MAADRTFVSNAPIWVRNHHHSVAGQPFADFTWRASRKVAAQRGLDDTNEMAVSVVLAALLRRAEETSARITAENDEHHRRRR